MCVTLTLFLDSCHHRLALEFAQFFVLTSRYYEGKDLGDGLKGPEDLLHNRQMPFSVANFNIQRKQYLIWSHLLNSLSNSELSFCHVGTEIKQI